MELAKELLELGKTHEALERLKHILPDFGGTQEEWKIHELIGAAFHDLGDAEGAAQACFNAAQTDTYLRSQRSHYSNYLFLLHYLNTIDNDDIAHEHLIYNNLFDNENLLSDSAFRIINSKLIIGYISPNFTESSSARFYEALLTEYNRNEFVVKCFSLSSESDDFTESVKASVNKFIILEGLSIEESAEIIANENVDIIFDLGGHTDGGMTLQIMSYKPAPVQIVGIGWFDTTGLRTIDYILTDNYLTPIGHEKYFSEKLIRMSSAFAFKPTLSMINDSAFCILHSEVNFGCFNNFMKITDEYLKCIKKILGKIENARFIMQDTTAIPARKSEMEHRLKKLRLPLDRIEVRLGNDDYLDNYAEIDIMLDTFPYNGGTMTATALYMGVPVISLYGTRHSSRFGADILRLAGMSDLIANSNRDYVELAIKLSSDREKLNQLKQDLRKRLSISKLLDTERFVTELEYHYKRMVGAE